MQREAQAMHVGIFRLEMVEQRLQPLRDCVYQHARARVVIASGGEELSQQRDLARVVGVVQHESHELIAHRVSLAGAAARKLGGRCLGDRSGECRVRGIEEREILFPALGRCIHEAWT